MARFCLDKGRQEFLRPVPTGTIVYVQETATVALRDWRIVTDYAEAFGVSGSSIAAREVVEYMRLWDILRRCCGRPTVRISILPECRRGDASAQLDCEFSQAADERGLP